MTIPKPTAPLVRRFTGDDISASWDETPVRAYQPTGAHFAGITRQVLFGPAEGLPTEWRYFEVAPGGYSALERHRHVHAVMVVAGRGRVLLGHEVHTLGRLDLVYVPPLMWHQFRADADAPLGFLCLVDCRRDRPERPSPDDLAALRETPAARDFIRC